MADTHTGYYLPEPSHWPLTGTVGLFMTLSGLALTINGVGIGTFVMGFGFAVVVLMMVGWFGQVIGESERGLFNNQVDRSYRWAMAWFIFSEVMFFAAFFGALFYARQYSVPWLDGQGTKLLTGELLWPDFEAVWPLLKLPDGTNFTLAREVIPAWGIPAVNTLILLSSGVTVTIAHHALKAGKRGLLIAFLALTVALGVLFIGLQAHEYHHAYSELNLKLSSGIYGATFFMLTGFHGAHVTIGATMLFVILMRCIKGHFTPDHHFAFEGVAWYWHFVDVVWLGLFVFVYWL
ncbi:MAG: cytochrome c oxidase subunit 3 [Gammaproteobacteria bacterium]|nr:cytochrome c oxidase subunit 3 [Gammaproteobacteria bacterium]